MKDIERMKAFNESMSNRTILRQCSSVARRWILRQIDINQDLINQLAFLVDLDTTKPQGGMIEAQEQEITSNGPTTGSGSTGTGAGLHDKRVSSEGWPGIYVRPF